MKLLIMPLISQIAAMQQTAKESPKPSLYNRIDAEETRSGQIIDVDRRRPIQAQIDDALEHIELDSLLDPGMPNLGGMEVLATIKRSLNLELNRCQPWRANAKAGSPRKA